MTNNLDKVLKLVSKTKDKVVVVSEINEPIVILPFDDYEDMIEAGQDYSAMSEKDILDKVNRDMNLWKQAHPESYSELGDIDEDESLPLVEDSQELEVEDLPDGLPFEQEEDDLEEEENEESIEFENVPPPPDLPVIDKSFDESEDISQDSPKVDEDLDDDGFLVEPIE